MVFVWRCLASILLDIAATSVPPDFDEPLGLHVIPRGDHEEVDDFVDRYLGARSAVAVANVGRGTKRHKLLQEIAEDDHLYELVVIGVQYKGGNSSLTMHRRVGDLETTEDTYDGRWTRTALREWLLHESYPLVARLDNNFKAHKYLIANPFGVVLVVQPLGFPIEQIERALEPFARTYRKRLKFTFFANTFGTQELCNRYGIWSSDELLLMERPSEIQVRQHGNMPLAPKYRLVNVTAERVQSFFYGYGNGTWPRYYKPGTAEPQLVVKNGIRELSAWDFLNTVNDPATSVLVAFVSQNCSGCKIFLETFESVSKHVQELRNTKSSPYKTLVLATIDQTANEHSEEVKGTPWLKYWPKGATKRVVDFELRNPDLAGSIVSFIDSQLEQEEGPSKSEKKKRDSKKTKVREASSTRSSEASSELTRNNATVAMPTERAKKTSKKRKSKTKSKEDGAGHSKDMNSGASRIVHGERVACIGGTCAQEGLRGTITTSGGDNEVKSCGETGQCSAT